MEITIKDIAKMAKVAPSTVSRALNNKGRMSSATRERIRQLAQELGYHPNINAKGLATNRTGNIGIIIHKRHKPLPGSFYDFYGTIIIGVEEEAGNQGYNFIFSSVDGEFVVPRCVKERRVDGLIIMGCDISKDLISRLKDDGVPLVLVDNHIDGVDSVAVDNAGGAYKAVEYLIKLGHRKIGFIAERFTDLSFKERFEGYKLALSEHGLQYNPDLVAEGLTRPDHGYVAMKKLFGRGAPSAVFAANDSTAVGAIKAIKERGLKVPDDIAVVGFDDGGLASQAVPPLTTVRVFREKMASAAAKRLIELIDEPDQPPVHLALPTKLIVRESCGGRRRR